MASDLPAVLNGGKTERNWRDARGRFTAGNAGGGRPANPYSRQQAQLRATVLAEVHPADLRAIVRTVLRLAKRGHVAATRLVFEWIIGPPPTPVHPDRLAEDELSIRRGLPTLVDVLSLADEQTDRAPPEIPAADEDADDPLDLPPPPLQAMLSWVLRELSAAQLRGATTPPPNPAAGWETFAASRLEWNTQAAVPVDLLFVAYARWCAAHGEPVLAEEKVLVWLTQHGTTVRSTYTYCIPAFDPCCIA